jgi:hypothetical protein|tara:strand:+ start:111 stop:884 length:774 start_codon:yes stop_codon:yes gene_type:complete
MKNNPFEQHGVNHLSASSINQFITNPARWILHTSGYRDSFGSPAMWRGIAVDDAICKAVYEDISLKKLQKFAIDVFDERLEQAQKEKIPFDVNKVSKERDLINTYVDIAIPHFRSLGVPVATQKKIKLELDSLPIPIIGYLDLQYDGVVRDIKTVNRLPSKMLDTTSRQLAIYAAAEKCTPIIDYVYVTTTKQEVITTPVNNLDMHMNVVERAAINMMNVLSYSNDISIVADLFMPNLDDWMWSSGEKQAAKKLWRI